MTRARLVMHPTDFSPATEPALEQALESALRLRAEILFLHVLPPVPALADEVYVARHLTARDEEETTARAGMEKLLERAKTLGVPASDVVVEGYAAEEIAAVAEQRGVELIVMGTHGRTGMRKVLLGSVAERVIAIAPCPVLTVRAT
jgi:nucleotide-binding universal stress UspA family protein